MQIRQASGIELCLLYVEDLQHNLVNPCTGKCWNIREDREMFRHQIEGNLVICGRKTYEKDWKGLEGASHILVLTHQEIDTMTYMTPQTSFFNLPFTAFRKALEYCPIDKSVYVVGGREIIDIFEPFATAKIITKIYADGSYERHYEVRQGI